MDVKYRHTGMLLAGIYIHELDPGYKHVTRTSEQRVQKILDEAPKEFLSAGVTD